MNSSPPASWQEILLRSLFIWTHRCLWICGLLIRRREHIATTFLKQCNLLRVSGCVVEVPLLVFLTLSACTQLRRGGYYPVFSRACHSASPLCSFARYLSTSTAPKAAKQLLFSLWKPSMDGTTARHMKPH